MTPRPVRVDVVRVLVEGPDGAFDPETLEARLPEAIGRELSVELDADESPARVTSAVEIAISRAIEGESAR